MALWIVSLPDRVDPVGSKLGHSCGSGQLKFPLVADGGTFATSGTPLVQMVPKDTHGVSCK